MLIDAQHLELRIDGNQILSDVDLHLEPGRIYGLLGPNGAGKSTTLAVLLSLYRRDGGRLRVLGNDPDIPNTATRRQIGVMPEAAGFYEWMNAAEYLQWYAGLYGAPIGGQRTGALLDRVGLGATGKQAIGHFSRGMRQRLALARAIVNRPRLLILDEPTNGLDPRGRRSIHDLLLALAAEGQVGILLCTHLLDDVERLCHRVGIIDHGRTALEGDVDGLLATYIAGATFRIRLHQLPRASTLPRGVTLLARDGDWRRIRVHPKRAADLPALWQEFFGRGWGIVEIRTEGGGLEEIYLATTTPGSAAPPERKAVAA